jgi:hypothetical protein
MLDEFRQLRKEQHKFVEWAGKAKSNYSGFCLDFLLPTGAIKDLFLMEKINTPNLYRGENTERFILRSQDKRAIVTVIECNSINECHESIIDYMMDSSLPEFPTCERFGMNVGDICFGNRIAAIFARFNIMCTIRSGTEPDPDLSEVIKEIDNLILKKPEVDTERRRYKPRIIQFRVSSLSQYTLKLGSEAVISFKVSDPNKKALMKKLYATGGLLYRKNGLIFYRPDFAGNHKIELFVTNEDGYSSNAELDITVI